jgi:integrase
LRPAEYCPSTARRPTGASKKIALCDVLSGELARAEASLGEWLRQGARAKRDRPGDPVQVRVADIIDDYVAEHGAEVVGVETLRRSARHLLWFFADDTVATMMPGRVKAYWEWRRTHSTHRRSNSPYVIAYSYGDGGRLGSVKKGFNSAAARAGIPDCTSHTLRHTAGTWMAHRGVPLYEIAGYLGHSEQRTTELYAHHHPDHMARAKRAMEAH